MADIELVIKISEETHRRIQALVNDDYFNHDICGASMRKIANGTHLPKGHGRLIDADALIEVITNGIAPNTKEGGFKHPFDIIRAVNNMSTIIEAEREE